MLLTTDETRKKLPTTERKNINRLSTWTDIIDICFQKEKSILYFSNVESNLSDNPTERVSPFVDTEDTTDFINFIEKAKVKNRAF